MSLRKKVYAFITIVAVAVVAGSFAVDYFGGAGEVSANSTSTATAEDSSKADETDEKVEGEEEEAPVPVRLEIAISGEISSFLSSTANLRAVRVVEVVNRTDGIIEQVEVEEGDFVREKQLLAKLDDSQLKIQLESSQMKLSQARLQLERASIQREKAQVQIVNSREEYDRYKRLYDANLVSEREVAQLKYKIDELEHDERISDSEARELSHRVGELESEIAQSQLEISRTEIRAPFSGLITERMVESGQTVKNLDGLFKLGDFSPLHADVFLSEREALRVRPGQTTKVSLGVDEKVQANGRVSRVSPIVDQSTGTVKVTVQLSPSEAAFKPGAFVRVDIKIDTHNDTLLIPKRALLEEDNESFVFVVLDEKAHRINVTRGFESESQVEILTGLSLGDQVVVAGQGALKEDRKVKIVEL